MLNGNNSFPLLGNWHFQPPLDIMSPHCSLLGIPCTVVFFRHGGSREGIINAHNANFLKLRGLTRNCKGVKSFSVFYENAVISPMSPTSMNPPCLHSDFRASICSGFLYVAVSTTAVDTSQEKRNKQ